MTPTPTVLPNLLTVTVGASSFVLDWVAFVSAAFVIGIAMFFIRRIEQSAR